MPQKRTVAQNQIRRVLAEIAQPRGFSTESFRRRFANGMSTVFDFLGGRRKGYTSEDNNFIRAAIIGWRASTEYIPGLTEAERRLFFASCSVAFAQMAGVADLDLDVCSEYRYAQYIAEASFIKVGSVSAKDEVMENLLSGLMDRYEPGKFELFNIVECLLKRGRSDVIFRELIEFGENMDMLSEVELLLRSHHATTRLTDSFCSQED